MARITLRLRAEHPHEFALARELETYPTGRRAARIRELLRLGCTRRVPEPSFADSESKRGKDQGDVRHSVYIDDHATQDSALREQIAQVPKRLRAEFLRARLIAGLLGDAPAVDIDVGACVPVWSSAMQGAPAPDVGTTLSAEVPGNAGVQPAAVEDVNVEPVRRPELLKLFS